MQLSTKSRYGLRAMLFIAGDTDKLVRGKRIAENEGLSRKYLDAILRRLVRAGLLKGIRGPGGGYVLARSSEKISIGEIFQTLEDGFDLVPCQRNPALCSKTDHCPARKVWSTVSIVLERTLNSVMLSDLAGSEPDEALSSMMDNFRPDSI